jgi:FKBP-type peptidyl-prolyl cis-trans isomerase 2
MSNLNRTGKIAYIRYRGGAKGEEVLDDRAEGEPLAVIIGEGNVPKGIEKILYEMEVGERRECEIPCELGYGHYKPDGVQWYSRAMINRGYELKKGSVVTCTNQEDHSVLPGRVVDATKDMVQIDVNHPYAGKTLEYWIELVDLT